MACRAERRGDIKEATRGLSRIRAARVGSWGFALAHRYERRLLSVWRIQRRCPGHRDDIKQDGESDERLEKVGFEDEDG